MLDFCCGDRIHRLIDMPAESGEIISWYLGEKVCQLENECWQLSEEFNHMQKGRQEAIAKEVQDIKTTWDSLGIIGKNGIAKLLISGILLFPDHINIE